MSRISNLHLITLAHMAGLAAATAGDGRPFSNYPPKKDETAEAEAERRSAASSQERLAKAEAKRQRKAEKRRRCQNPEDHQ